MAAVIPNAEHESLNAALDGDAISGYEHESGRALASDMGDGEGDFNILAMRSNDAASNIDLFPSADEEEDLYPGDQDDTDSKNSLPFPNSVFARAPADCNNVIRSGIDSCKRNVQSHITTCKKKIVDDVAACHITVRQDIDKCKKKAKDPFTKGRCELNRKPRDLACEARRKNIPICEKNRPKVLICCEGLRTRVQALCAAKVVPTEAVRNGLLLGQQICIRGL